jgi:hypothetical protein
MCTERVRLHRCSCYHNRSPWPLILGLSHVNTGTREYLETQVLPHVHTALAALLHKMQEERLQVCMCVCVCVCCSCCLHTLCNSCSRLRPVSSRRKVPVSACSWQLVAGWMKDASDPRGGGHSALTSGWHTTCWHTSQKPVTSMQIWGQPVEAQ